MSDPAGWENDPGKKFMMKLVANPLASSGGYHLAGGAPAVDKGKKREDESSSFQATALLIKLQKKGYPEVRKVPIEAAQTWGELRAVIRVLYAVSDEPQIVTFEGDLIRSNDDYARVLKPGLHLVVSYPSALTDLAFEFSRLFPAEYRWDRCPSKEKESTTSPSPGSSAIESLSEATRDHASPASSYGSPPDIPPRKSCHLQPPKLTFYPPKETRFHVTLANARFPDFGGDCGDATNAKHGSATGWAFESQPQEKRRRLLCSISWTFAASPANSHPAVLTDAVSNLARQTVDWAVSPDPPIAAAESSERRFYANCDGDGLGEQMCQGWWMAGETLLPASFAGEEGDRTLLLRGISHTEFFLTDFLKTCGVPGEELNAFVKYWIQNLSPVQDIPPEDYLVIVKFLTPKQMDAFLPVRISPVPDRMIRIFPVFRVLTQEELLGEKIVARGVFGTEVGVITKGMGVCRGGSSCSHDGCVRVFELGGARVFGSANAAAAVAAAAGGGGGCVEVPEIVVRDASAPPEREFTPGLVVGEDTMVPWMG